MNKEVRVFLRDLRNLLRKYDGRIVSDCSDDVRIVLNDAGPHTQEIVFEYGITPEDDTFKKVLGD